MEVKLILAAFLIYRGLLLFSSADPVQLQQAPTSNGNYEGKIREDFRNLFDSIATQDNEKKETYREILKDEVARERHAFGTMKEQIQSARNKNSNKNKNFYKRSDNSHNVVAVKREINDTNDTEHQGHDDISAETLKKCDPKVQKCFVRMKKLNILLREENTQLKQGKMQLEKEMECAAFLCALTAMRRSIKFLLEEVVRKIDEVRELGPVDDGVDGSVHPIISRLAPPSKVNASQREYREYKEFFRVLSHYTELPDFFRNAKKMPPLHHVIEYLDKYVTTDKHRDEFAATIPSVYYLCEDYQNLNERGSLLGSFEKNHSIPSLSVALSADNRWAFNEIDLAYVSMLRLAVNQSDIDSKTVIEKPAFKDIVFPVLDPKSGC